ncbi:hypothetical protein SISNIDRAFT_552230 [Sistotremastrum niveocremeum HHB9708]|uniref:Uncharacterized protein n=2 Tax=Sistotremastraceae TaxID=3402574 RepID=A0A164Q2G6_9AGAM|nr:hypothetical protein SISNIDRAFT_552230 [Sistotremastrum niveocremeum HHB9708]KZT39405.1 hypothetical protein SISSUDRAFT_1128029 [Sistotremastrum suecicum HHB10207 ss-3]
MVSINFFAFAAFATLILSATAAPVSTDEPQLEQQFSNQAAFHVKRTPCGQAGGPSCDIVQAPLPESLKREPCGAAGEPSCDKRTPCGGAGEPSCDVVQAPFFLERSPCGAAGEPSCD